MIFMLKYDSFRSAVNVRYGNGNNPSSIIDYRSEGCYNALQKMNDVIAVEEADHGKRKYKT